MKSWAPTIAKHIETWTHRLPDRAWWPQYLYHFTDVHNAASVLNSGALLCRNEAVKRGLMKVDNASTSVIGRTGFHKQEFVRLYFRPRTPTQYRNEGIRVEEDRNEAHCPMPVFLCFEAFQLLADDRACFTEGNLAADRSSILSTEESFCNIPFEKVFTIGPIAVEERNSIVYHRNAEVLFPHALQLTHLRMIKCRSIAELETLLHLLSPEERLRWSDRITLAQNVDHGLYFREQVYIESVEAGEGQICIRLHPAQSTPKPMTITVCAQQDGSPLSTRTERMASNKLQVYRIRIKTPIRGVLSVDLDGCLAFKNRIIAP